MLWFRVAMILLALVSLAATVQAKPTPVKVLARDVAIDDVVLVAKVPDLKQSPIISIVIIDQSKNSRRCTFIAREGEHAYDVRDHGKLHGRVLLVGTPDQSLEASLRQPTAEDELDMFLTPQPMVPATVNLLTEHTLLGVPWDRFLLLLFAAAATIIYFLTQRIPLALFLGFCAAWAIMDLRTMWDHAAIVQTQEEHPDCLIGLNNAVTFVQEAAPIIGEGSWTVDETLSRRDVTRNYIVGYGFADRRYLPLQSDDPPVDFVITSDPSGGEVMVSRPPLYLVRRHAR